MAAPPPPPPQGHDDKQVCYAEQHDLDMSKSHVVLPSDAPIAVSGPWPDHRHQQQQQQHQQYSPPPPSSTIPNYPTDQHSSAAAVPSVYPASVAPSMGWHSGSPPPPSATYTTTTQGAFGPLPPPPPPPQEMAARGGGDKDGLRILGLRPATFFLSIALAVVIVVAAVGGGVGGSIAVENAKRAAEATAAPQNAASPPPAAVVSTVTTTVSVRATATSSSTPTPTPARAKVAVPPTQGVIDFDCSSVASTLDFNLGGRRSSFETLCGQDLVGAGVDILGIIVYNHAHCAQACASYNRNLGRNECVAVSFQADLAVLSNFGNCFLKNSTGTAQKKTNTQVSYKLKPDA